MAAVGKTLSMDSHIAASKSNIKPSTFHWFPKKLQSVKETTIPV
jgi:hypothetical protein